MKFTLTSDTHYGMTHKTHIIHEKFLRNLHEEIVNNGSKALIHAGDWNCNKQDQFQRTLVMFRKWLPNISIIAVRGNHCLWDYNKVPARKRQWGELQALHTQWFKDAGIHHLENDGPYIIDNTIIVGWDGWYHDINPPTNDAGQMIGNVNGVPTHLFHNQRAFHAFDKITKMDLSSYDKAIAVTHMPPWSDNPFDQSHSSNPAFLPIVKDMFDVFCTGHSHRYRNKIENDCLLLNCGSDYDKPKWLTFDTEFKDPNKDGIDEE